MPVEAERKNSVRVGDEGVCEQSERHHVEQTAEHAVDGEQGHFDQRERAFVRFHVRLAQKQDLKDEFVET